MTNKLLQLKDYMEAFDGMEMPVRDFVAYMKEVYNDCNADYSFENFIDECIREYEI